MQSPGEGELPLGSKVIWACQGQIGILADFNFCFFLQNYQSSAVSEFCWLNKFGDDSLDENVVEGDDRGNCTLPYDYSAELSGIFLGRRKVTGNVT